MAKRRRSKAARRRRAVRLTLVGAGVLVLVVVFWSRVWPYLLAAAVAGVVGAVGWWAWRTHRTLRERDRVFREEDRILASHRSVAELDGMSGTDFEKLVAALLRRDGCTEVRCTGGPGDHGVDVVGRLPDGRSIAVQCKRYAPHRSISNTEMITLLGSQTHYGADVAVFVTTARITAPAEKVAVQNGILAIHRDHLGHWRSGTAITAFAGLNGTGTGTRKHLKQWKKT